ncbi:hypothetical protein PHYBLDRAFT_186950 [Phycomyces blakesleeanus NRRL 1555(-)]|uniref:Cyclin-D1-binding protein 1-like N-terminal domain-containing protein n=1 Tax=Phycomyces blakesleeanus (strain ATCC 8743b / DSM 1359 / FGSC 10004 / NBRC 33097 / NRRL 1555) TaxID=763407 RepID=A0A163AJ49_PHYB8|nr:hypothetical protein PHYBLDRAFT_186950 [Phycomyces blakesleeanus NRRL 1555(-)]OAD73841.1 hypothetical protein PHYBLDRAFT_186950 [Phycomyces blakesleeanus NRRL 1555(-)]|eukprot:XP_018291881.1 hypothetical protein PHYBLDRAFT_186950 [Phycomyces blakesleeanus NRRL 1555(-)]
MATEEDVQTKLKACCAMCMGYLNDLKDTPQIEESKDFDSVKFKDTMAKLGQILSHDATKLTLACKPPRQPADAIKMIQEISNTLFRLLGFYHSIPISAGRAYLAAYTSLMRGVLQGTHTLCSTFSGDAPTFMIPTAVLWENCAALGKSPKNNEEAVRKLWIGFEETLKDAKSEAREMLNEEEDEDDFEDSEDSEEEEAKEKPTEDQIAAKKAITEKCVQLTDLTVLIYKKIEVRCLDLGSIEWLDRVSEHGNNVVDETDVLISQLYEEDADAMTVFVNKHVKQCIDLVKIAQEVAKDEHAKWFEMCATKLETLTIKA